MLAGGGYMPSVSFRRTQSAFWVRIILQSDHDSLCLQRHLVTGQLWSLATTTIAVRMKIQLNTILFAKTLVRKDVASSAPPPSSTASKDNASDAATEGTKKDDENDFSSKSQIMTLMTTDVDRVSDFAWHVFALVGMFV